MINSYDVRRLGAIPRRIAVTSGLRREGVTTVSQTLSVVLADDFEASVCWVDMAWLSPGRTRRSNRKKRQPDVRVERPGLVAHLAGEVTLDEAISVTNHPTIDLLRPGKATPEQLSVSPRSSTLDAVMDELSEQYEFVIFDTPPVLGASAALPVFRFADTYLLVVRSGVTHLDQIRSATELLDEVPHLGSVLNHHSPKIPKFLRRLGET